MLRIICFKSRLGYANLLDEGAFVDPKTSEYAFVQVWQMLNRTCYLKYAHPTHKIVDTVEFSFFP